MSVVNEWTGNGEPTLDDVRHEFGWECWRDTSGLYYARRPSRSDMGVDAQGEDPRDLRDMIIRAKWQADVRSQRLRLIE